MIEKSLRVWLRPIVNRQKRLYIMKKLSLYWFIIAIFGIALIAANKLFGWTLPGSFGVLIILAGLAAAIVFIKSGSVEPDYLKLARSIEAHNPDLKATLLTAIEQKPKDFGGQLDYLQERVIGEALEHARQHNWVESIPNSSFVMAGFANAAAIIFFLFILSNFSMPRFFRSVSNNPLTAVKSKGYEITVTPGDTTVELGTSVVILARFNGKVPDNAKLYIGPSENELQEEPLTKNLEDPVFGTIIPRISSDMIYRIEYDDNKTKDYTIGTFQHPSLERADANIVYPAYTKIPNKEIKDTRRFSVVEGSKVTLNFSLNKPVETAQLVPKDGSPLNLTVDKDDPTIFTTIIEPNENLRYELKLVDSDGRTNKVPPRFVIDVHKNLPPELKLNFPKGDIDASPLEEVTLEGEVSDDYGVTSSGFAYIMAGSQSRDIVVDKEPVPANKKDPIKYVLAMEDLKAQPDQLVSYYMWAEDIGPDGKPRKTVSDLYFAEVRDFEQIFRENQSFMDQNQQQREQQQQQQQQEGQQSDQQRREQLVQMQKQIISATWNIKRQVDSTSNGVENKKEDINLIMESQSDALEIARNGGDQSTGQGGGARGGATGGRGGRGGQQGARGGQGGRGGRGVMSLTSRTMSQISPPSPTPGAASSGDPMDEAIKHMESALEHLKETLANSTSEELLQALASEQAAYQELLKLREQENQVARNRSNQQQNNQNQSQRQQQQLQQLEMRQREDRYEMQNQAQQEQQQQEQQREDLQVLNRLRDLARRQNEMTDRLRETESALREAQNEQERQEIQRELERLREEQIQNMRDADELQQRMENQQNRQRMSDSAEQLSQTRERMQQAAEQMQQGQVSEAAANSTRAQSELEQMREDFQQSTSGQFSQQMQNMRQQARELDQNQQQISQEMTQQQSGQPNALGEPGTNQNLAERVQEQRDLLEQLLDQMKEISEQSEDSEPLLSRRLYDTYRQASTENVETALETTEELLRRNFVPQAQSAGEQAQEGIQNLRKGIEEAAQGVLGNEEDSLRLARQQLDEALQQLGSGDPNQQNMQARNGQQGQRGSDPNQMGNMQAQNGQRGQRGFDPNQMGNMQAQNGQRGQRGFDPNQMGNMQAQNGQRGQRGFDPNQMGNMQAQNGQRGQRGFDPNQMGNMQAQNGQRGQRGFDPNQEGNMQAQEGQRGQRGQRGSNQNQEGNMQARGGQGQFDITQLENMLRQNQNGQGGGFMPNGVWDVTDPNNPLTGQNFRQWSDQLREVEEMLPDQELREQVAEVRERARQIREDYTRNSEEPQWDMVNWDVVKPLVEVRERISEELAKIASKEAIVPIDRDPVPERYSDLVRAYYENLGGDN